jgi:hypothetical protein
MVSPCFDRGWFRVQVRRKGKECLKNMEGPDGPCPQSKLRVSVASVLSESAHYTWFLAHRALHLLSSSASCSLNPSLRICLHSKFTVLDVVQVRPRTEKHVSSRPVYWHLSGPNSSPTILRQQRHRRYQSKTGSLLQTLIYAACFATHHLLTC